MGYLRENWKVSKGCTVLLVLQRVLSGVLPTLLTAVSAQFIDSALEAGNIGAPRMFQIGALLFVLLVSQRLVDTLGKGISKRLSRKGYVCYSLRLAEKSSRICYPYVENAETCNLIERVSEKLPERMLEGYINILDIVEYAVRILALSLFICRYVWWFGLVLPGIVFVLLILAYKGGTKNYEAFEEAEEVRRYAKYLNDILSKREYVKEKKLFGYEENIKREWRDTYENARVTEYSTQRKVFIRTTGIGMLTALLSLVLAFFVLPGLTAGTMSPGVFISLMIQSQALVSQMSWGMTNIVMDYAKGKNFLRDYEAFFALNEVSAGEETCGTAQKEVKTIEYRNVTFRYPSEEEPVLKNFSLKLEAGKQYAMVGENAAGKTTAVKLLLGLYENYEGEILINRREIRGIPQAERTALMNVIFQDYAKYYLTIRENILLGRERDEPGSLQRVAGALEQAGLGNQVETLTEGADTRLGKLDESDMDFSEGQWQRLALARGTAFDKPILIMDEPTASLDPLREREIFSLFSEMRPKGRNKISILITHRLAGAQNADCIVMLKNGAVYEMGSHSELLERKGAYYEMYETQKKWYGEKI